jgi:hypothetical protein
MKRMIFHIPMELNPNLHSGSQIRPRKMIEAFERIGYSVSLVMGDVGKRKRQISSIKAEIEKGIEFEFVYSESSTMPTALTEKHHFPKNPFLDFRFLRYCKNQNLKVGLFYRDIHWGFSQYKEKVSFFKRQITTIFYKYDLVMYKSFVEILYLPSVKMFDYIPFNFKGSVKALPPGVVEIENSEYVKRSAELSVIYVGGLGGGYDLRLFGMVMNEQSNIRLNLCTREKEWQNNKKDYGNSNIIVHHESGDGLAKIYEQSSIASLFVFPSVYWDFVMAIKLFEYIAYRKPIIAVKGTAVGEFIENNDIGWVVDYEKEVLVDLLAHLKQNSDEIELKRANMCRVGNENTWTSRASQVADELNNKKGNLK